MKELIFRKGEVIFRQGDIGKTFYQVTKGTAGVYLQYGEADQQKLTNVEKDQYFGEMAIIEAWPRSATVVAEDELHVIEITAEGLNAFFEEQPERIISLMKQLGKRIRVMTDEYEEINAVIQGQKKLAPAEKPGFFSRLFRFGRVPDPEAPTQEEIMKAKGAGSAGLPVREYKRGQVIFREGDEGEYMYSVQSGRIGIYTSYGAANQQKLTDLYSDTFFGEMGLIDREPRSATAVVEEDGTTLECIREQDLQELFRTNPIEVNMILSHLSNRLRKLTVSYSKACAQAAEMK